MRFGFRSREEESVPFAPAHRRVWHRFRRRCSCGLSWPCLDQRTQPAFYSPPRLTLAQRSRRNGGRW